MPFVSGVSVKMSVFSTCWQYFYAILTYFGSACGLVQRLFMFMATARCGSLAEGK